ncbi:MAG: helix-turn-helix domain-containing protein [Clostridia bacterium]|nr:helix-turn-helix domain-containing protein [Clostridia bacterium]
MDYGKKISNLRKSHGMTQEELGKELNVTYQAVSKWERGESQPDFATMSQIAKIFEVPLSYFEDGEQHVQEPQNSEPVNYAGVCTSCGRMLKDEEVFTSSPKIVCKSCAERQNQDRLAKIKSEQEEAKRRNAALVSAQLGGGCDAKLIVSLLFCVASYVLFLILFFTDKENDMLYGAMQLIVPLAVFACVQSIFEFIHDLRSDYDDGPDGYKLGISLIVGGIIAVINFALFLVMYINSGKDFYYMGLIILGTVLSFAFVSQIMWGSVLKDIFTCGGFTFKLPGFIFSLTPESIIWMLVTKVFLGILSIFIYIITTLFFALVSVFGSAFTFIPCIISKAAKDNKAKSTL